MFVRPTFHHGEGEGPFELQNAGAAEVYPNAVNLLEHFAESLLGLRAPFTDRLTS